MMMIKLEVYTFVTKEGEVVHINMAPLKAAIIRTGITPILAEIGDTLATALEQGLLGVEEEHALKLSESALDVPAIVGTWGDSDHIVMDGNHRLWRRWKRGDTHFPAYVIPEKAWRLYCIPNELVGGDAAYWDHFNRNAKVR